jgi:hypothetical protein
VFMGQPFRRLIAACSVFAALLVGAAGMYRAYGSEVFRRALHETAEFFTNSLPLFFVFWVVTSALSIWGFHKHDERKELLRDAVVSVVCGLAGALVVFLFQLFFTAPYGMYADAKRDAAAVKEAQDRAQPPGAQSEAVQERVSARQSHLERLRAVLLADAKGLSELSRRMRELGFVVSPEAENSVSDEWDTWNRNVLVADLERHFPEFFSKRVGVRKDVSAQDAQMRSLVTRTGSQLRMPANGGDAGLRRQVALALVHRCSRNGFGFRLIVSQGSYSYAYSLGGSGASSGAPSETLIAVDKAFRSFVGDASFNSECAELKVRADDAQRRLAALSAEAGTLAETTVLRGECEYLPKQ